jgi:hypothetical protein
MVGEDTPTAEQLVAAIRAAGYTPVQEVFNLRLVLGFACANPLHAAAVMGVTTGPAIWLEAEAAPCGWWDDDFTPNGFRVVFPTVAWDGVVGLE